MKIFFRNAVCFHVSAHDVNTVNISFPISSLKLGFMKNESCRSITGYNALMMNIDVNRCEYLTRRNGENEGEKID